MPPRLRITAGPDVDNLARVGVNDEECVVIDTEAFQGRLMVRVKDFVGDTEDAAHKSSASYFEHPHGSSMSYSIQVQGRFLDGVNCDNLVFGNTFDEPIRVCRATNDRTTCHMGRVWLCASCLPSIPIVRR